MASLDKPRLRNSLRKLRVLSAGLDAGSDRAEAAQETLDFLAVQHALKPVLLLGRGLDDPAWVEGVSSLGREVGLRAIEAPFWDATPYGDDLPQWYVDDAAAEVSRFSARYLCRTAAIEARLAETGAAGGRLAVAQEAALLGYPECCVAAHYDRALAYHRAVLSIVSRAADGDENKMRSLLQQGIRFLPETEEEKAVFDAAMTVIPAPYGSWNLCRACAADPRSPSAALSRRYRRLAEKLDREWAAELASLSAGPGPRWTP